MANVKKPNKIKKSDYSRVLVTETLPYETPIIFSSEGLYRNGTAKDASDKIFKALYEGLVLGELIKKKLPTVPYTYKIRKGTLEYRKLALIHPISHWQIKEFYEKYEHLILHLCSKSPASLRAPERVASTFYTKSSWENINQYKTGNVAGIEVDRFTKYSPSFFSYRGHDRLYKFFESKDFFDLEKSFPYLWTLDVSKCFDSIYTHCMSWAVKDKEFTKKNVTIESTFAQSFDAVMRNANHNETNGIVIGPEVSRIFSEIIFQEIDSQVILRLKNKYKYSFGSEYSFRRYVDDIFIFSKDEVIAKCIYETYTDTLGNFNLHANIAKSLRSARPFFTKKSRVTREVSECANDFLSKFLEDHEDNTALVPKKIFYKWRLTRSFIESIKAICSYNESDYDAVSSYLISVLTERVKKLANVKEIDSENKTVAEGYKDASLVLLEVLFFLYGVAPTVGASYKLCTSIIVLIRFSEKHFQTHTETIKQKIFELTESLLASENIKRSEGVEGFVSLEAVNIVLAIRELGVRYPLPEITVSKLFLVNETLSYFDIISCLFYIRDNPRYKNIKRKILKSIENHLSDFSDIATNSEKACLFLDMLSCPYISDTVKKTWISKYYRIIEQTAPFPSVIKQFLDNSAQNYWFVNWIEVDLLNALEKKELKQAY